jgi:hypothetical protein
MGATDRVIKIQEAPPLLGDTQVIDIAMIPMVSVYGDGTWIRIEHVSDYGMRSETRPALAPASHGTLSADRLDQLLAVARDAGLLEGDRNHMPPGNGTLDYPQTVLTVTAAGATSTTAVYGLATTFGDLPPAETQARARIADFLSGLDATIAGTPSAAYAAYSVRVWTRPFGEGALTPAQTPVAWPLADGLQAFRARAGSGRVTCGVPTGPDATAVLAAAAKATDRTPWTSGGESFTVILRPLLPGESGCAGW